MAGLTPLGDIITVQSRQKLHEIIEAKADELGRRFGLTMMERNEIATRMFVAVMQTDVVREKSEEELEREEELHMTTKYGPADES